MKLIKTQYERLGKLISMAGKPTKTSNYKFMNTINPDTTETITPTATAIKKYNKIKTAIIAPATAKIIPPIINQILFLITKSFISSNILFPSYF